MQNYYEHIHELKTWPMYFRLVETGVKLFDLRKDDRPYTTGDLLLLREYDPDEETYSGCIILAVVTCVVRGEWLAPGYVALGIRVLR